jgi:hypothetical protein
MQFFDGAAAIALATSAVSFDFLSHSEVQIIGLLIVVLLS